MEFFSELEGIIETADPVRKRARFDAFYRQWQARNVRGDDGFAAKCFESPSYAALCEVVSPKAVPKRKNPASAEGQAVLLHAIAHIEYSAIDLALDHCYRFTGMPEAYYDDWLAVAEDEFRHFAMLHGMLDDLGFRYGDFPVHDALFEAAQRTPTLIERMAIVPRYFEAGGLDATPQILKRFEAIKNDAFVTRIVSVLQTILREEVDHVRKGDRWFAYACEREGVGKSVFFEIVERHYPGSYPRQRALNVEARKAAGFACEELERMAGENVCR